MCHRFSEWRLYRVVNDVQQRFLTRRWIVDAILRVREAFSASGRREVRAGSRDHVRMGEAKLLAISWPQHHQMFLDGIWNLYLEKYKADIEIRCQGHVIWAHQMVLALFCPALKDSLPPFQEGCDPPCLNLDYVSEQGRDLQLLVEFIYRGKICVSQDRLKNVKDAAQTLGVDGLVNAIERLSSRRQGAKALAQPKSTSYEETPPLLLLANAKGEEQEMDDDRAVSSCTRNKASTATKTSRSDQSAVQLSEQSDQDGGSGTSATTTAADDDDGRCRADISGKKSRRGRHQRKAADHSKKKGTSHCAAKAIPRFVCEVCSKAFKNRESFRRHVRRHGDPDAFLKCPHCDFRTLQKSSWVQHLAVLHKVDPQGNRLTEDLECPHCDFVCVTKYQLRSHVVRKHTVDKPFKCAECEYATVMKSDIEKHVSIRHRHERLYMCETCGFRSQTQGGYNRHVRSHSGIKPFKCELCGQAYADSPKLKIHLQKHVSDDKPFVCHLCGHACRRMDNLQMHLRRIHKTCIRGRNETATDPSSVAAAPPATPGTGRHSDAAPIALPRQGQSSDDTSRDLPNSVLVHFSQALPI